MKNYEEKIENTAFDLFLNESGDMSKYRGRDLAIKLAKSEAAKEFHQQGMYLEEEVLELLHLYNNLSSRLEPYHLRKWFEQNKKK